MRGKPVMCPFCGRPVDRPRNLGFQVSDFDAGVCECGAVYVSDVTGFNQGAAFLEALVLACGGNWDLAWELTADEDYKEFVLEGYDQKDHLLYGAKDRQELGVRGVLYFLRLVDDVRDISIEKLRELREERSGRERLKVGQGGRRLRRPEAENMIREGQYKKLMELCYTQPYNLRVLQRLLYSADLWLRWQSIMLLGKAADLLVQDRPDIIVDLIRRLIYASADSAASAWGALETVGEIIRRSPERFGIYVKNLFAFLRFPEYRPGALWALARIGERHPQLIRRESPLLLLKFLEDKDDLVRGLAAWAMGCIGLKEAIPSLKSLLSDQSSLRIFRPQQNTLIETTVSSLAQEALNKLQT